MRWAQRERERLDRIKERGGASRRATNKIVAFSSYPVSSRESGGDVLSGCATAAAGVQRDGVRARHEARCSVGPGCQRA